MAKYQSRSFIPASILKCACFLFIAVLVALLVTVPVLADVMEVTTSQTGTQNWSTSSTLTRMRSCDKGIRFVHNDFYIRSPSTSNNETFAGDIYLGYDYDHYDADNDKDVFTISATSGTLALKNTADSKTITIGNLYMAKGTVIAWGKEKPTLAGNIHVASSEATINSQDATIFYLASSIVKDTSNAVLNLVPYDKNGKKGEIFIRNSTNINCPLNLTKGTIVFDGSTNAFGSDFRLTLQDGTTAILGANFIGVADTSIVINGSVQYGHWQNTSANKVNYSDLIVPAGSTLTAYNKYNEGAKGSMVFAGDLQGAGALVVDTVGTTNTNSLTLGHPENSFTGTVSVNSGKLQFTVLGFDEVTYTGTNALINAASVSVASGATIDVGTTEQTLNNLSGAGNITLSGGALTLNNTSDTEFTGGISGTGAVTKTGSGTLKINAAQNAVDVESFVVSSGRLDMKEYFKGDLEINNDATFSPGNSIGTLNQTGNFTLDEGATLLMEIGTDETGNVVSDQLIVNGNIEIGENSIILLALDENSSLAPDTSFTLDLISGSGVTEDTLRAVQDHISSYYFTILNVTQDGNVIRLSGSVNSNAVPEPSTWALLILGAAGLLFWRKKK